MARSLLGAFVSGARTLLSVQLLLSVIAIALVGWTLGVTSGVIRERDLLRERVVQLESAMAERGMVVPPTQTVVSTPATDPAAPYPDEVGAAVAQNDAETDSAGFGQIITGLFAPAPPMRVVVLHVRNEVDAQQARALAQTLATDSDVSVVVDVMAQGDGRLSGYSYFDGRQNRAAADLITAFLDTARNAGIAPWSAQLRGAALPARGEFTADRLDIVLPPLPPPPAPPPVETPLPSTATPAPG